MANYTAGEEKLYDPRLAAIQQIKLPDRATLKLLADSWLRAVIEGSASNSGPVYAVGDGRIRY
jgi:hypothetical protein